MFKSRSLPAQWIMRRPGHSIFGVLIQFAPQDKLVGYILLEKCSLHQSRFAGREIYKATFNLRARLMFEMTQEQEVGN
jgi:hypothetical protein